ncbi:hypothetical protein COOONC_04189 [Cooperia oncophora]
MGPIGGRYSINAVQLTDSPYVVLNMRILTRQVWVCNPNRFFLALRPSDNEIWSFGSAFGENAFLSKKCLGLRLASYRGWKEGWIVMNAALIAVKGTHNYFYPGIPKQYDCFQRRSRLLMLLESLSTAAERRANGTER